MQAEWLWGLAGGLMIGTAAAFYLLMQGRIMGISGILGGLIDGSERGDATNRVLFILALIAAPAMAALWIGEAQTHLTTNPVVIIAGGLLVGFGTRLANGCTSGHGVCGISRLSPRGIVASAAYVLAGGVTMALLRHVLAVI